MSEDGATAAVRKFKTLYRHMKESTVRGFKSTCQEELKKAMRQSRAMTKALPEKKRGRPLMLGAIDLMVQSILRYSFFSLHFLIMTETTIKLLFLKI